MNQLISMVSRLILRRLVNRGVDAGVDLAANRGRAKSRAELTPADRERAQAVKQTSQQAKDAAKLLRRVSRFR